MGKYLHEVMGWPGPMTHRQLLAWTAWLEMERTRPTVLTEYLVYLIAETRRSWVKKPAAVKPEHCRLKFGSNEPQRSSPAASKAAWLAAVGLSTKKE